MAAHRLIQAYTDDLVARLPLALVEEVADGLADTYSKYVDHGLSPDEAAHAAVAEFGDAADVVHGFVASLPERHVARRLIVTGPAVGICWAVALIAGHAWAWPAPAAGRALVAALLIASITALVRAALGRGYLAVRRAGAVGCIAVAGLDATVIGLVLVAAPTFSWLLTVGTLTSATRLICVARQIGARSE